jgi:hypothetical protein
MAIESGGGPTEDPQEVPSPTGESLSETPEYQGGIHALNEGTETGSPQEPIKDAAEIFVAREDIPREASRRMDHFPVNDEVAAPIVTRELFLVESEGEAKYISATGKAISRRNPGLISAVTAETKRLAETVGQDSAQKYALGALIGYRAIEEQSDGSVPVVTVDMINAAKRDVAEEQLLASLPFGEYTPRPGPDEGYLLSVAKASPNRDTNPIGRGIFWNGANDVYRLVKGAEEVRKLEAQAALKHRP